jgi:hypothetical protein
MPRVRFSALPDFLRSSGSGTGSTQPLEYNWGLGKKSSGSGLENREYGRRDPSRWPRGSFYPQKLSLTSPTRGGRSVGIVRSRTRAKEISLVFISLTKNEATSENSWNAITAIPVRYPVF